MVSEMTATSPEVGTLSAGEARHFQALERRVEKGMQSFREVGEALLEIRDKRLFRMTHPTFETYCSARWGLERARAYQLMGAAEVLEALPAGSGRYIVNEVQARELVPVLHSDPKLLPVIMKEVAAAEGPLTGPRIREVVARVTGNGKEPIPERNSTTALVALLSRSAIEYEKWSKATPRPSRADKALVREAAGRLLTLLSG